MGGSIAKANSEEMLRGGGAGRDPEFDSSLQTGSFVEAARTRSTASGGNPSIASGLGPGGPVPGSAVAAPGVPPAIPPQAPGMGEDLVPTVFTWDHGGNQVFITGTFNAWSCKVEMSRSGGTFTYVQALPRGKHAYKFIVDDGWRFAPDQPTVADTAGNINNFIDLTDFRPDSEHIPSRTETLARLPYVTDGLEEEEYNKDPPLLPPHLRQITLNAAVTPPYAQSPHILPTPQHVTLNHLYCTTIRDKLMVQGITQRYKGKHVTTVYYSIMPLSSHAQAQMAAATSAAAPVGDTGPSGTMAAAHPLDGSGRASPLYSTSPGTAPAAAAARGSSTPQAYAAATARAFRDAAS